MPIHTSSLRIVTTSEVKSERACPRKRHNRYKLLMRPVVERDAQRFGTLVHHGLEAWWLALKSVIANFRSDPANADVPWHPEHVQMDDDEKAGILAAAIKALDYEGDPWTRIRAQVMMEGYHGRWINEPLEPIAVEVEFTAPMVNADTGEVVEGVKTGGKIDVLARRWRADGTSDVETVEHKSSGVDFGPGSKYRRALLMDSQVSMYADGAAALGYDVAACTYDILGKLKMEPKKATPVEERKYTQPRYAKCPLCNPKKPKKGDPTPPEPPLAPHTLHVEDSRGTVTCEADPEDPTAPRVYIVEPSALYAKQRATDEPEAEYLARYRAAFAENAPAMYERVPVARLGPEMEQHRRDVWEWWLRIEADEKAAYVPRNPDACESYGTICEYEPVCAGRATLDDPTLYRKAETAHTELSATVGE